MDEDGEGNGLNTPLPADVRHGLGEQITTGVPWAHFAALILLLINVVMIYRRFPMGRIVVNNVLAVIATLALAATLGMW